ncbi:MAG: UDP-N-acetylmuramoyl-L-alanyl-D-glutamate--2,6-diaminopimelate ligase, partial [Pseudomonadota bacterium]
MRLKDLLPALEVEQFHGDDAVEISSVVSSSRQATPRSIFVAIPGLKADGHDYLDEAYRAGARVFVTARPYAMAGAATLVVPDTRAAFAALTAQLYRQPSQGMKLIGITGTNGKTTTAYLVEAILKKAGFSVGLLSTIAYRFSSRTQDAERTTPDQLDLQRILREMADAGTEYVVMEVSSHGLKQRRVDGCHFDAGIFTNLTPEHLDYHVTMEDYYASKERFFTDVLPASAKKNVTAVINQDDPSGRLLLERGQCRTVTYGLACGDIHADRVSLSLEGITADVVTPAGSVALSSKLIGTFNLYNILAATAAAVSLEIPLEQIRTAICGMPSVPGRMERIENTRGILVFVDFAHTGDALQNVLSTLKKNGALRIITLFGCGGDRDRQKRPVMGSIAAAYSSAVILTSDNPRSESPEQIIREIEAGVIAKGFSKAAAVEESGEKEKVYFIFQDRKVAIQKSISMAGPGDVVLIAGKGHE